MGWVSTPRPGRFTPGKDPVPVAQEVGWAAGPVSSGVENLARTVQPVAGESLGSVLILSSHLGVIYGLVNKANLVHNFS